MPAASNAVILGPRIHNLVVRLGADSSRNHIPETRPPGTTVVFRLRLEKWKETRRTYVRAGAFLIVQRMAERTLRVLLEQNIVLLLCEQLPPILLRLFELRLLRGL